MDAAKVKEVDSEGDGLKELKDSSRRGARRFRRRKGDKSEGEMN